MPPGLGLLLSLHISMAMTPLNGRVQSLPFSLRRLIRFSFNSEDSRAWSLLSGRRGYCGYYMVEQFSDDEYECEFDNQKPSSSVANTDEWRFKLSLLLRNTEEQEIISKDKRDRRDYEQISNLAKRMGLYSEIYGKVVVASKIPLPNYRPDLDDKRPQREVVIPLSLQRRVEGLVQEHLDRSLLVSGKHSDSLGEDTRPDENEDSLVDGSVMEKILQRKSCRMRSAQRAWQESPDGAKMLEFRRSLSSYKEKDKLLTAIARNQSLLGSCARKMTTSAVLLNSTKVEITNSGLKLLVAEGRHAQKMVGIWLFGCAAWVFSMVVLGGVTRLTRSGLSMTDWKFTGSLPPLSEEEWLLEFKKYQQSPEYQRVNKGMSMEDFKFIYWMEYAHRMWGRGLGVVFALPFTYFLAKGFITRRLGLRLSALFALGAGQGLIGWWMVKSGLEEPASKYVQPRVSPYRLATHLISAFVIYSGVLWTALSVVMPEPPNGSIGWVHGAAKVRKMALPVGLLVGITALSGALVAGNDAGHAFNTFPKMGESWVPDDIFSMEPLLRNFFENTSMVQLNHRILATTTLISVGCLWLASRKIEMHPAVKSLIGSTLGMAALQVTLGISTLLSYVPVSLGSAHQAGALTLLSLVILLTHTVRKPSPAVLKSLASLPKIKC